YARGPVLRTAAAAEACSEARDRLESFDGRRLGATRAASVPRSLDPALAYSDHSERGTPGACRAILAPGRTRTAARRPASPVDRKPVSGERTQVSPRRLRRTRGTISPAPSRHRRPRRPGGCVARAG